jgi:membrane-associated protease RseP (regulator of RpoE activity)
MSSAREPDALSKDDEPQSWRRNLVLFLLTVMSVLLTATVSDEAVSAAEGARLSDVVRTAFATRAAVIHGTQFTVSLLAILLAHEFGHYIAARIHKVDTSLPFFIPLPILSPFGTMGAVIRMRGAIPTRRALLDIGASGPLAGLCLAVPIYYYGAAHSRIVPVNGAGNELGESLLLKLLDHLASPNVPEGHTLLLSPFAFAAWAGMFVTMINLLPVGQLDGGHVAYALFGKRQDVYARNVHRATFAFFVCAVAVHTVLGLRAGVGIAGIGSKVVGSLFWLSWFQMLAILGTLSRKDRRAAVVSPMVRIALTVALVVLPGYGKEGGPKGALAWTGFAVAIVWMIWLERTRGVFKKHGLFDHPEVSDEKLDGVRSAIAILCLVLFAALFMPAPFSM